MTTILEFTKKKKFAHFIELKKRSINYLNVVFGNEPRSMS